MADEEPEPVPFFLRQGLEAPHVGRNVPRKGKGFVRRILPVEDGTEGGACRLGNVQKSEAVRLHLLCDSLRARRF